MTLKNLSKAPFPWFGGKSKAAPLVWELLGDVEHYVEPFAGSLAVLLNRPHPVNTGRAETVNDLDGLIVNAWRAIQWHPEETAEHASWPVSELDKMARELALTRWREDNLVAKLGGSAEWCDPKMAGWWLWGVCIQIGAFVRGGPWTADENGMIVKIDRKAEGYGEPGVKRDRPHLSNGRGVNRSSNCEPGVLSDQPGNEFHPHTMPELVRWFQWLSARLRHVRILNGDWARLVTDGASKTLNVRMGGGHAGIFLDPPYADTAERSTGLYGFDDFEVAHKVKAWCAEYGDDPDRRIVLAGYDGEHDNELADLGWTSHEWFTTGYLQGGYSQQSQDGSGHQQDRERLWASPHCLNPADNKPPATVQGDLFA
jgi:site-specific DNA-adenine methylase